MKKQTIAHYEIRRELGRGGMGIVYEAEDTKLHRTVALKVLSPHLLSSEDDRARFYREARSAAALNHPNIATVYAVDEIVGDDGEPSPFIAMEYIDGHTLSEVIAEGPVKLEDAIRITIDAARALNAAHNKDIVHRDVKSGNLMMTSDRAVKVLDFGLAKSAHSTMLTKTGSTLGTAAYMSPEQAQTMDVDGRSDIWSLGVVLYEMVAGKLPFGAAYEQAVVYSILNSDPEPLTSIRTGVPMELDRIVTKCLMKDPGLRYQHADDLVADLSAMQLGQSALRTTTMTAATTAQMTGSRASRTTGAAAVHQDRRPSWIAVAVGLLIGALAGGGIGWFLGGPSADLPSNPTPAPVHHLTLKLPDDAPLAPVGVSPLGVGTPALDISDDGRLLVYVAQTGEDKVQLFLRELDSREARPLPGTEGATVPFFSPDASWIAFRQGARLMKISTAGGGPIAVGEAPESNGGDWGGDGFIWSAPRQGKDLMRISANGGEAEIIDVDSVLKVGELPTVLPGDEHVLVSSTARVSVVPVRGGKVSTVLDQGSHPRYTPSGHLVFALPGRLMAAPFELESRAVTGPVVPVVEGVRTEVVRRAAQYAFSKNGTLVYAPGAAADQARLVAVGVDGNSEPLPFDPDYFGTFALSPDAGKLAIHTFASRPELWLYDLVRGRRTRIEGNRYGELTWTPDGERLIHVRENDDRVEVVALTVESGTSEVIVEDLSKGQVYSISPDGRFIGASTSTTVGVYELGDTDLSDPVFSVTEEAWGPHFSPDGDYLSYTSLERTGSEIYVVALDGSGRTWQISDNGGEEALWSQDGRWLFYSRGETWYRVPVSTDDDFTFGEPEIAFEGPYLNVPGFGYAVFPSGERFIVLESVNPAKPISELYVIENWFSELQRLAPTGGRVP